MNWWSLIIGGLAVGTPGLFVHCLIVQDLRLMLNATQDRLEAMTDRWLELVSGVELLPRNSHTGGKR